MGLAEVPIHRPWPRGRRRGAAMVLADHLTRRQEGDLEGDLEQNYAEDVVVISHEGIRRGRDAVRATARILADEVGAERYEVVQCVTAGRVGYLRWRAIGRNGRAHDGVDSFVVEDGRIIAQTIHYSVTEAPPR